MTLYFVVIADTGAESAKRKRKELTEEPWLVIQQSLFYLENTLRDVGWRPTGFNLCNESLGGLASDPPGFALSEFESLQLLRLTEASSLELLFALLPAKLSPSAGQ